MTELDPKNMERIGLVEAGDDVVHAYWTLHRSGRASQEEALVGMIEHLSEERRRLTKTLTSLLMSRCEPLIVVHTTKGDV